MLEFEPVAAAWIIVCACAFFVGLSKTGIPGVGILVIPTLAYVMDAKESTGFLLPMLIVGDIFAVAYYRRHAVWKHLVKLLPAAVVGVIIGYRLMGIVNSSQLKIIIGWIIVVLLVVDFWRIRIARGQPKVPTHWSFAVAIGVLGGAVTMMANGAGPLMIIYLLAMRLDKNEFMGTGGWYFLIINCFKVPFSAHLGLITAASLKMDLMLLPLIAAGAICGRPLLKRIPQNAFVVVAKALTLLAAFNLCLNRGPAKAPAEEPPTQKNAPAVEMEVGRGPVAPEPPGENYL